MRLLNSAKSIHKLMEIHLYLVSVIIIFDHLRSILVDYIINTILYWGIMNLLIKTFPLNI